MFGIANAAALHRMEGSQWSEVDAYDGVEMRISPSSRFTGSHQANPEGSSNSFVRKMKEHMGTENQQTHAATALAAIGAKRSPSWPSPSTAAASVGAMRGQQLTDRCP